MRPRIVYAALAALVLAAPASAEPLRLAQAMGDLLPPHEILTIVRSTGFDPLGQPIRRGPNYVLRAVDSDDREVSVVVDARHGTLVRVVPIMNASRLPPGTTMGPYERMEPYEPAPPGEYISPGLGRYGAPPPVAYEDDGPDRNAPRPPGAVPGGSRPSVSALPPPVITATPPAGAPPSVTRRDITTTEPGDGLLPPPPERFPQRARQPTAATAKPVKRTVAAIPKLAPLPKPRPQGGTRATAPRESENKSVDTQLPN